MNRFGISETQLNLIKEAVSRFDEIESAVIFGSRAMGNYKPGSDVDIAIKGRKITARTVSALSSLLNEELPLPHFFDVVHYNTLDNKALIRHIDEHGNTL
ncbi:MAG: nucleotidyltransferase domain-containing protein [Kiritimatiellales bacterium]